MRSASLARGLTCLASFVAVVLVQCGLAFAQSSEPVTTINFDGLAAGTHVAEQYASLGVHFVSDYSQTDTYRSDPKITAFPNARSSPHVLVNEAYDSETQSSVLVPLQIWFDRPVAGIGVWLGTTAMTTAIDAKVSLYDCSGQLTGQWTGVAGPAFNTVAAVLDPTGKTVSVVIDYRESPYPEAIDDLAFQFSSQQCTATAPPAVYIEKPRQFEMLYASSAEIRGWVLDNSAVIKRLEINGAPVGFRTASNRRELFAFVKTVNLAPGGNTFSVLAVNGAGLKGSASVSVSSEMPTSVTMRYFNLTQRGVIQRLGCNIDGPMVAGKSTLVRVNLDVRSSSGAQSYLSHVEMKVWRRTSGAAELVGTFLGESYSAVQASASSPSQMSGINFWVPGRTFDPAGDYGFTVHPFFGTTPVGVPLTPTCGGAYIRFAETKPVRLLILPVEGGFYSQALQQTDHVERAVRALESLARTYPVRDWFGPPGWERKTGVRYFEAAPLRLCDGSQTMKNNNPLCKGTGFAWKFIDKDPGGVLGRADAVRVSDKTVPNICADDPLTLGGRVKSDPLITHRFDPNLGIYLSGAHPSWYDEKFIPPMDVDHDGDIDRSDLQHFIGEFYDQQTKKWSTDLNSYNTGETFRFFIDKNGDNCNDIDTEPQADTRQLFNSQQGLYSGPALQALTAHNRIHAGTNNEMDLGSLWFPHALIPPPWFGQYIGGGGQGDCPGPASWVGMSGNSTLPHELGHNVGGLKDLYGDDVPDDLWTKEGAWMVFVGRKAYSPLDITAVMSFSEAADRVVFLHYNYKTLFDKLKIASPAGAPAQAAESPGKHLGETRQIVCDGVISLREETPTEFRASFAPGWTPTDPDSDSPYRLVFRGSQGEVLQELPFPVASNIPPPEGYDWWPIDRLPFQVVAAFPEATQRIELRSSDGQGGGDRELARIVRTEQSPEVTLLAPSGGSYQADEQVTIRWRAIDRDSESLTATLYYAPDGETEWRLLADGLLMQPYEPGIQRGEYLWNLGDSPGTAASGGKVRVVVSDGLNSGQSDSPEVFRVAGKPPAAVLLEPAPNETFFQCERIRLRAVAFDPEKAPLRIEWQIDGASAPQGEGAPERTDEGIHHELLLPPLLPGAHKIGVKVVDDRDDFEVLREVTITVTADSDCDGMSDEFEESHGLAAGVASDAAADKDQDGLSNFDESIYRTNPSVKDTDQDSMGDGWEVANSLDPLIDDSAGDPDQDGFTNREEHQAGTNPRSASEVPPPRAEESATYPQLALGGPYQCVVMVANMSDAAWEGTVYLRRGNEEEWSTPWSVNGEDRRGFSYFNVSLAARATGKFVLAGVEELRTGYLRVGTRSSSSIQSVALSYFFYLVSGGGLEDSTGVPRGVRGTAFAVPVEKGRWVNTGFAWAPALPSSYGDQGVGLVGIVAVKRPSGTASGDAPAAAAQVTATLFDSRGEPVAEEVIPFDGHLARFFTEIFGGVPDGFVGKVVFQSSEEMELTVLRMEITKEGRVQLTSAPPVGLGPEPGPAGSVYPQLALGGGYQCILMVGNKTGKRWVGWALLRQGDESAWSSPAAVDGAELGPGASFLIDLQPDQTAKYVLTGDEQVRAGYLRIVPEERLSTGTLTVSFFYNYLQNQGLADSTGAPGLTSGRTLVFPVEKSGTVNTGFAWIAESPGDAQREGEPPAPFAIRLALFDEAGNEVGQRSLLYEGHVARFFTEVLEGIPRSFVGSLRIEAEQRLAVTVIRLETTAGGFQLTSAPPVAAPETPRPYCYTMEGHQEYSERNPEWAAQKVDIERLMTGYLGKQAEEGEAGLRAGVVTIPVVVHVIYKTDAQNISEAQIKSQIEVLNKDYRKLNADISKIPKAFQPAAADAKIQFKLAARDQECKATTGIHRHKTDKDSFTYVDSERFNSKGAPMKFSTTGGVDAWPRDKYLNIWVCNLSGTLLGFATFPGDPANVDGVVIDYEYFGNTGTAKSPYDLGRTVTHEVAHWLNLRHIWGDDKNEADRCSGSDQVSDTPNQELENYGTPVFPKVSCKNGPNGDMFMDYMDYTDDKAMFMFTAGQVDRMEAALFETRSALLGSDALFPPAQGADLFSQDSTEDIGSEPNTASKLFYASMDIWVRKANDGLTKQEHQNPIAGQTNYVYVRVRNRGCADAQSATVRLYWAKASTGLSWPKPWDGSVTTPALMGGVLGEQATGTVKGGSFTILKFTWTPPSPANYAAMGADKAHFCLLSRIETSTSAPYGMTTAETTDLTQNVRNNNNIVWKNLTVAEPSASGGKEASTVVGNNSERPGVFSLRFSIPEEEDRPSLFDWGIVRINLGGELYAKWERGGMRGKGVKLVDGPILQMTDLTAILDNLELGPGEFYTVKVEFIPLESPPTGRHVFELLIEQLETVDGQERLVGGQTFLLKSIVP